MMTGNPLSGHTAANQASMTGSGVFTDSLKDGEHITSPSLTNMLEGVHGNGIILEEDTAAGDAQRHTPEDLPGVCEQVTNTYTVRIEGGHAVIDGVVYAFAGGPGSTQDVAFTTTSAHKRASYSALSSGQEALIVVYVSTDTANQCITWELGSAVTTASNTYPTTPSAFLSNPKSSGLDVTQSVVLAVIRVVYSASGGDLKLSISESNDKRIFIRPSPIYFTPVTTGAVAATTPVDTHAELDAFNGDTGNFTASRLGGLWQSFGAQIASTTAGDNGKDVLYYSGTHAARFTRSVFDRVLTSTATSIDLTAADANILVLTPSGTFTITTSGPFPAGYIIEIKNTHGSNTGTFALTNSTTSAIGDTADADGGYARFVCTVSHATDPTFVRLQ
tara:strand:- start:710 stop:1879 length:1170 start_codon:yes stop_codon:yes gene_type:complete